MQALRDNNEEKFIGAYVSPIVGKYEWIYDLDLTLYPSIIMSINISPETKVGKIEDWVKDFVKDKRDKWIINGDTITQENLKKFFDKSKFSVASNGVLYRTDTVGCI